MNPERPEREAKPKMKMVLMPLDLVNRCGAALFTVCRRSEDDLQMQVKGQLKT